MAGAALCLQAEGSILNRAAVLGGLLVLALVPAAGAHLPTKQIGGYVSTISRLEPDVLGVRVVVLAGDERLRLANLSGKTIVILAANGEPLFRFTQKSVARNTAAAGGSPRWVTVSPVGSYEWDEPRISWNSKDPPASVRAHPDEPRLLRNWSIAGLADGKPFAIKGFLGYAPPLGSSPETPSRVKAILLLLGVAVLAVALAFAFYVPIRRPSSSKRSA